MIGELLSVLTCTAFLGFFLIVFGFFAFLRYLQYRETVVLAEKGLIRPVAASNNTSTALRWGIVITALGLALSLGFYPFGFLFDPGGAHFPLHFGPWMLIGLVPLFFGVALILIHVVSREKKPEQETEIPQSHEAITTPKTESQQSEN